METNSINKKCLACLNKSNKMHSHQEVLLENLKILEILYKIVPLLRESRDFILPEWICAKCLEHLLISYRFREQCLKSIRNLQELQKGNSWAEDIPVKNEILSDEENPSQNPFEEVGSNKSVYKQENKETKGKDVKIVTEDDPEETCYDEESILRQPKAETLNQVSFIIKMEMDEDEDKNVEETYISSSESDWSNDHSDEDESSISHQEDEESNEIITFNNDNQTNLTTQEHKKPELDTNSCHLCDKTFKTPFGLKLHHTRTHLKDKKTFNCNQCDKVFSAYCLLSKHLITHSEETPHKCNVCGKGFKSNDYLRQHTKRRHAEVNLYQCPVCQETFKLRADYKNHKIVHKTECKICGVRLSRSKSMADHRRIHSGEKPHKCRYCDKRFIRAYHKTSHEKTHTSQEKIEAEEKLFKCPHCQKAFTSNYSFKRHLSIHSSETPYKCSFCDKSFKQEISVKNHERIHTGEKPYKCPYCLKDFRDRGNRNTHVRRLHKNELNQERSKLYEEIENQQAQKQ